MNMDPLFSYQSIVRAISERTRWRSSFVADAAVFGGILGILYAVVVSGRIWFSPFTPVANISGSPRALPLYAAYSLVRIVIAYLLALVFALAYGLAAAKSERAAKVLLPLLDILQSIPVLSFLPGVMLAMVALFPGRQIGLELGSVLLIFTGLAWNIAFSFYASLKGIPRELDEAARLYRFSAWQRFGELELPFAAIGLVWNSMMSVAGGWFFLMACEMFVLGKRDFRLPGLGSYLQVAAEAGDTRAIVWGMVAMIAVIVLLDQLVWRPVIAWSDKFKFESVEGAAPQSFVLTLLRRSGILAGFYRRTIFPMEERVTRRARKMAARAETPEPPHKTPTMDRAIGRSGCARRVVVAGLSRAFDPCSARLARTALAHARRRLHVRARECGIGSRRAMVRAGGRVDRHHASRGKNCAAAGANCGIDSGHGAVSDFAAVPDSRRRWDGHRGDGADADRHAVVHPLQRDRRSDGHSHGPEGSLCRVSVPSPGAMDASDPAGDFSVSCDGAGDGFRRRVERQHRRRVFPLSRPDDVRARPGSGDQPRDGFGEPAGVAGGHAGHVTDRRDGESHAVAKALPPGRDTLQTGSLSSGFGFPRKCQRCGLLYRVF